MRVLDLSADISGSVCARLLADYGADVVKVQPPAARTDPGVLRLPVQGSLYRAVNANKRSVTLDLRAREGRRLFERLVSATDVLVHDAAPGDAVRRHLGLRRLRALAPDLVIVSVTPFGENGPHARYKADSIILDALSGMMYLRGVPEDEPLRIGGDLVAYAGGVAGAIGALAAYVGRGRGAPVRQVEVSALEALAVFQEIFWGYYVYMGIVPGRGFDRANYYPGFMRCRDGFVMAFAWSEEAWQGLLVLIERPELADDPRFTSPVARAAHLPQLRAEIAPWFAARDKRDIFHQAQELRLSFGYLATIEELLNDPQERERGFFVRYPNAAKGVLPGAPFAMSRTPFALRRAAPSPGEHNRDVFGALGLPADSVRRLETTGVV